MKTRVQISSIFHCTLERAFRTPMLCDITKVHTGFGPMPRVTHCTDDEHWGVPGHAKKVFVAPSLTQKGGWASMDTVIERIENQYWKIEVGQLQTWMLGFTRFVGEWQTTALAPDKVLVSYTYTLHAQSPLLFPLQWVFAQTFWRIYMKRVMNNIRRMAYANEPYLHT